MIYCSHPTGQQTTSKLMLVLMRWFNDMEYQSVFKAVWTATRYQPSCHSVLSMWLFIMIIAFLSSHLFHVYLVLLHLDLFVSFCSLPDLLCFPAKKGNKVQKNFKKVLLDSGFFVCFFFLQIDFFAQFRYSGVGVAS